MIVVESYRKYPRRIARVFISFIVFIQELTKAFKCSRWREYEVMVSVYEDRHKPK